MAVQFDTPPGRPARRTQQTDLLIVAAAAVLAVAAALAAQTVDSREKRITPAEVPWPAGTASGSLVGSSGVSGIQTVTLKGDPSKAGLYTILLRVGPNTKIQAHAHPDDRAATDTLNALRSNEDILQAAIYTSSGRLFASYQRESSVASHLSGAPGQSRLVPA